MKSRLQDQAGLGLVESLVAVAVLGVAVVTFISALSTGSLAVGQQKTAVIAQGLAQSQLEYTKSGPYLPEISAYPAVEVPPGYSLSVLVSPVPGADTNLQKITVIVRQEGAEVLAASAYKVNR